MKGPFNIPIKIEDQSDNRGFSFNIDLCLHNFHVVSIKPGKIRGNHVHDYDEIALIIGGKKNAQLELGDGTDMKVINVDKDFYPILFPAFVRHKVKNIGENVFYLVCFAYQYNDMGGI